MTPVAFTPSYRLRSKYRLVAWIVLFFQLLWSLPVGLALGLDIGEGSGALIGLLVALILNALWFLPTLWLVDRYYDSISYELHEDEIIVRVGIWTQSVKHVPFRTVTNIAIKRDIFDRFLFNIGTVEVQTAGASGTQQNAEEQLAGLVDFEGIYNTIAAALRRYRAVPMSPTQAGSDLPGHAPDGETMAALLTEVRAIRLLLDGRR